MYASAPQTDAIMKVTSTCICGSDLHLYLGFVPGMEPGIPFVQPDSRPEQLSIIQSSLPDGALTSNDDSVQETSWAMR